MQGVKPPMPDDDATEMKTRQIAARLALAALVLAPGSMVACTGQEHAEVIKVGEKAKKDVERINEQINERNEPLPQ
jgi:hypothetical protein